MHIAGIGNDDDPSCERDPLGIGCTWLPRHARHHLLHAAHTECALHAVGRGTTQLQAAQNGHQCAARRFQTQVGKPQRLLSRDGRVQRHQAVHFVRSRLHQRDFRDTDGQIRVRRRSLGGFGSEVRSDHMKARVEQGRMQHPSISAAHRFEWQSHHTHRLRTADRQFAQPAKGRAEGETSVSESRVERVGVDDDRAERPGRADRRRRMFGDGGRRLNLHRGVQTPLER